MNKMAEQLPYIFKRIQRTHHATGVLESTELTVQGKELSEVKKESGASVADSNKYAQHYFKKDWKDLNGPQRRIVKQHWMKAK